MLKKRLMGVVVVKDGIAVQSIRFCSYLPVGQPEVVVEYLNQWGIDEIAVIDISATRKGRVDTKLLKTITNFCQVPVTFGGGMNSVVQMTEAVKAGADKVMLNQAFLKKPEIVSEACEILGKQCVVVSIDAIRDGEQIFVYDYLNKGRQNESVLDIAKRACELGAGEILLNSVDRDGSKTGFDLELARAVCETVNVPVTICGGAGKPEHFVEGLAIKDISAVAAANYFNYTEHSATIVKEFVRRGEKDYLRHDTYFDYEDHPIDEMGRLGKKDDAKLKELLFEYHPKEVI